MKYSLLVLFLFLVPSGSAFTLELANSAVEVNQTNSSFEPEITESEAIALATGIVDGNVLSTELVYEENYTAYVIRVDLLDSDDVLVAEIDATTGAIINNYQELTLEDKPRLSGRVFVLEDGEVPAFSTENALVVQKKKSVVEEKGLFAWFKSLFNK